MVQQGDRVPVDSRPRDAGRNWLICAEQAGVGLVKGLLTETDANWWIWKQRIVGENRAGLLERRIAQPNWASTSLLGPNRAASLQAASSL